jgi:predicted kinase
MEALAAGGVPMDPPPDSVVESLGVLAYGLMTALLQEQLEIGQSVVIECGASEDIREKWRNITRAAGATFLVVDTICSNVEVHRRRFEARGPTWSGEIGQTWHTLDKARSDFRPHPQALFVADSVRSVQENVDSILALIEGIS